jgi:hypothetical protein
MEYKMEFQKNKLKVYESINLIPSYNKLIREHFGFDEDAQNELIGLFYKKPLFSYEQLSDFAYELNMMVVETYIKALQIKLEKFIKPTNPVENDFEYDIRETVIDDEKQSEPVIDNFKSYDNWKGRGA